MSRCGRRAGCALALTGALAGPAAGEVLDGDELALHLGGMLQSSTWTETDAQGRRLLREQGQLQGVSLGWGVAPGVTGGRLELQTLSGRRDYAGQSSTGVPVHTRSDLQHLGLWARWTWALDTGWQLEASLGGQGLRRSLRGTAQAVGYTERWRWAEARAGLGHHWVLTAGRLQWQLDAGLLLAPQVDLQPGSFEPLRLRPGTGHSLATRLGWSVPMPDLLPAGTQLQVGLQARADRFGASAAVPGFVQGQLRAAFSQPLTRQQSLGLTVGIERRW